MYVYIVRWHQSVDGETFCGNFEVCYANEEAARRQMLKDWENIKKDWSKDVDADKICAETSQEGDWCGIEMRDGSHDYHEWYIDKLELQN